MTTAQKLQQMQDKIERAKVARIRSEAARDEILKRIRAMGYETAQAAQKALQELNQQIGETEMKLQSDLAEIEKQYPQLLED